MTRQPSFTYEVMLDGLAEGVLKATSVDEALQILLRTDVALILTDVSMPTIDGFEFAKILREHPRSQTHPSSLSLRSLNNVPVAPELLRAKVKVFLDLYRKQRELAGQKAELERRVAERNFGHRWRDRPNILNCSYSRPRQGRRHEASTAELAQSEERYRALVDNASDIAATLDLDFCSSDAQLRGAPSARRAAFGYAAPPVNLKLLQQWRSRSGRQ
jgi:CheY-like chemotaxis protein